MLHLISHLHAFATLLETQKEMCQPGFAAVVQASETYNCRSHGLAKNYASMSRYEFLDILFEGDCLQVIKAMNNRKIIDDELSPIVFNISIMVQQARGWKFHCVNREANRVAHVLAKFACRLTSQRIWMEEYPPRASHFDLADKHRIKLLNE